VQHAAVRVESHDRKRLEQLCRYITRPALSDERVQLNAAGQVELKLKAPWRDGTTHLIMTPLEFMQRLAALVPRPRLHLIRFGVRVTSLREVSGPPLREHGVLAPNAKLRALVVPQGPPAQGQAATEAAAVAECAFEKEGEPVQARPHRIQRELGHEGAFEIISGYRAPATNARLRESRGGGVARHSLHMEGRALDLRLPGVPLSDLRDAARAQRGGGVGFYAREQFVHLDTGRVRGW
jgi:hypothetical protein